MDELPPAPPAIGLGALFLKFLRFGCLAFGGPVAQIAMVREALVEDERWISRKRFNRLLAVMQVLPGPEAHELCVHMAMIARGRIGGLLAGLGFMLPGFVLMMVCGWAYASFIAGQPDWVGVLLGVQAASLAIILRAVYRIGEHVLTSSTLIAAALVALAGTLFGVPFWIVLLGAAIAFALFQRSGIVIGVLIVSTGIGWLVAGSLPFSAAFPAEPKAATDAATLAALFVAGLKGGLLTFGLYCDSLCPRRNRRSGLDIRRCISRRSCPRAAAACTSRYLCNFCWIHRRRMDRRDCNHAWHVPPGLCLFDDLLRAPRGDCGQ